VSSRFSETPLAVCEPDHRVCAAIDMREEVEIERREQRLGGHEPVGDGGNIPYVLNRLGLHRFRHDVVTLPIGQYGR